MKQIQQTDFNKDVIQFKGTTLVDFYADWCGPCRMLSPILEEMSKENKDESVQFVKVNVDENRELAGAFNVMSIPTVVIIKDGKVVDQHIGVMPKDVYNNSIKATA